MNDTHQCIPGTYFTKISGIVGSFMLGHVLKYGEIRSMGSRVMWFKGEGVQLPQNFYRPLVGKLYVRSKRFTGARMCSRLSMGMPCSVGLGLCTSLFGESCGRNLAHKHAFRVCCSVPLDDHGG